MGAMGSGTFAPRHSVANIVIGKDSNEKNFAKSLQLSDIFPTFARDCKNKD